MIVCCLQWLWSLITICTQRDLKSGRISLEKRMRPSRPATILSWCWSWRQGPRVWQQGSDDASLLLLLLLLLLGFGEDRSVDCRIFRTDSAHARVSSGLVSKIECIASAKQVRSSSFWTSSSYFSSSSSSCSASLYELIFLCMHISICNELTFLGFRFKIGQDCLCSHNNIISQCFCAWSFSFREIETS